MDLSVTQPAGAPFLVAGIATMTAKCSRTRRSLFSSWIILALEADVIHVLRSAKTMSPRPTT